MRIQFQVEEYTRCDLVGYSGINMSGKKVAVRIFPGRSIRGTFRSNELRSLVIRASFGTQVVLATRPGSDWEDGSWRCINLIQGFHVPSAKARGFPGVRIPDLDLLNAPDAKRIQSDFQSSFPMVSSVAAGEGWTYGHIDTDKLKGNITRIIIRKVGLQSTLKLSPLQQQARSILQVAHEQKVDCFSLLVEAAERTMDADEKTLLKEWV
ncbi:MAG: hypothetical protein VX278_02075, partial [Myxococcota bacterium]|nr:hypothetical protein [Myxococcota bacterium]